MASTFHPPSYPVVQFLVNNGTLLSFVLSALVLLGTAGLGMANGMVWLTVGGVIVSVVLLGILLSYIEVLKIIADTLLPKY